MIRPNYIPPSLLVEGLFCKRRLWLKSNNIEIFEEKQALSFSKTLKTAMNSFAFDDSGWFYEARLPSGSRLDAWIPDDALGIEFKSGKPQTIDLYQVWAIRQELSQLGVNNVELQLWYPDDYVADAEKLADYFQLEHGMLFDGIYAICADKNDPQFLLNLERSSAILIEELNTDEIPKVKEGSSPVCQTCSYFDWCFSGEALFETILQEESISVKKQSSGYNN